jgi:hypothetical protein
LFPTTPSPATKNPGRHVLILVPAAVISQVAALSPHERHAAATGFASIWPVVHTQAPGVISLPSASFAKALLLSALHVKQFAELFALLAVKQVTSISAVLISTHKSAVSS